MVSDSRWASWISAHSIATFVCRSSRTTKQAPLSFCCSAVPQLPGQVRRLPTVPGLVGRDRHSQLRGSLGGSSGQVWTRALFQESVAHEDRHAYSIFHLEPRSLKSPACGYFTAKGASSFSGSAAFSHTWRPYLASRAWAKPVPGSRASPTVLRSVVASCCRCLRRSEEESGPTRRRFCMCAFLPDICRGREPPTAWRFKKMGPFSGAATSASAGQSPRETLNLPA